MTLRILLLGGLFLFSLNFMEAQSKVLDKANELYRNNHFSEAAKLYETALAEKFNLSVQTKLANCYRMNNRLDDAEQLYASITKDPKARAQAFYYYGEVLMSKGKYDEAKTWFLKYERLEPEDERGKLMAAACDEVKTIQPFYPYLKVVGFSQNSDADDSSPALFGDAIVFSSDRKIGVKLMKEKSGWTGRDFLNLYSSTKDDEGKWSTPKPFSAKLNELNKNTGNPSFTKDQQQIFFTRNAIEASRRNAYNMQIFSANYAGNNRWKDVEALNFCSPELNYMHPAISPDGQWIVFVSDRKGEGGTDLWFSKKNKSGWGSPKNLGSIVNTPNNEGFPYIDAKNRLFFCSKGHTGYGGFDVFMSEQDAEGNWQKPVNLGTPINSPQDDISIFLREDGQSGMFTSNRHGGDDDIYLFEAVNSKEEAIFINLQPLEKPFLKNETPQKTGKKTKEKSSTKELKTKEKKPTKDDEKPRNRNANQSQQTNINIAPQQAFVYSKDLQPFSDQLTVHDVKKGQRYRLKNAVYDFQVYQITPKVVADLNDLATFLKENPTVRIELGAHTDSFGTTTDNLQLSQNRVTQAAVYLYSMGIAPHQLVAKGYGESQLINHCKDGVECGMKAHLENQRLEVVIIGL